MKHVTLNSIQLTVATKQEVKELVGSTDDWLDIGHGLRLYGLKTRGDYIKASGLEKKGEVDYAVPQNWADTHKDWQWYVWFYGEGYFLGKPMDIRILQQEIVQAVLAQVV